MATARQVDVPPVSHEGMLVMVHALDCVGEHQVTALNFSEEEVTGTVRSEHLVPGSTVRDMVTDSEVDELTSFTVTLRPHDGLSLLVSPPEPTSDEDDDGDVDE